VIARCNKINCQFYLLSYCQNDTSQLACRRSLAGLLGEMSTRL